MLSGYVDVTEFTPVLLDQPDAELGIRYPGFTNEGTGIIAFDAPDQSALNVLGSMGELMMSMEPHPDYPDSWPWGKGVPQPTSPKRGQITGSERFVLLRPRASQSANGLWQVVAPLTSIVVAKSWEALVLIELQNGDVLPDFGAEVMWDRRITAWHDARLVSA